MTSALRQAYELIRDEEHWCQGLMAADAEGWSTMAADDPGWPRAVKWCASGAVVRCQVTAPECDALVRAAKTLFPEVRDVLIGSSFGPVVAVNDTLGHAAVLQCFEKALVEVEGSL